jgi:hypothetical protein
MNSRNVTPIFEANMEQALRSHYRRARDSAVDTRMPFDRLITFEDALRLEDDGIDDGTGCENTVTDYEMRQRSIGVRAFLRWLKRRCGLSGTATYRPGPVSNIMLQLFAAGRAMGDPFFSSISFTENGLLFSQTKAAASNRSKLISGVLKKSGAKGIRQTGQKTPEASDSYARVQAGNSNRRGGPKPKQHSFLRKLETPKSPRKGASHVSGGKKPRQATFTRKLNGSRKASPRDSNGANSKSGSPHSGASHIRKVA